MLHRPHLAREAARLGVTVQDVKTLYREAQPAFRATRPLVPASYLHPGDPSAMPNGTHRFKFFDLPRFVQPVLQAEDGAHGPRVGPRPLLPDAHSSPGPQIGFDPPGESRHQAHHRLQRRIRRRHQPRRDTVDGDTNPVGDASYDELDFGAGRPLSSYLGRNASGVAVRTVAAQTAYRESDAQTEPYTPEDLQIRDDEEPPEVLSLTDLTYQNGLLNPINKQTLREIDRVRRRQRVERELPMGRDPASFAKRCAMLRTLEMHEWNEREEKIRQTQSKKFHALKRQIERGQHEVEERNQIRVEEIARGIHGRLRDKLERIRKRRGDVLGRVLRKYGNPERKKIQRDVLDDEMFERVVGGGGQQGQGQGLARTATTTVPLDTIGYELRPSMLSDPFGVAEIEKKYARKFDIDHIVNETVQAAQSSDGGLLPSRTISHSSSRRIPGVPDSSRKLKTRLRRERKIREDVTYAKEIKKLKLNKLSQNKDLLSLYRKTPRIYRPRTPVLRLEEDENDEVENAVVTLQKLLRGRSVQNSFCIRKKKAKELIAELQQVEKVRHIEEDIKKRQGHRELMEQRSREHRLAVVVDNVQGKVIGRAIDYLSKELVRQRELEKVEAVRAIAEMERRKRQEHELSARRREEANRDRQQVEYNEMLKANDMTISTYLDQLFAKTADRYAHKMSVRRVRNEMGEKLARIKKQREEERQRLALVRERMAMHSQIDEEEEGEIEIESEIEILPVSDTPATDEEEIRDLVSSFVLPQVKRELLRSRIVLNQRRFVHSAQKELLDEKLLLSRVVSQIGSIKHD